MSLRETARFLQKGAALRLKYLVSKKFLLLSHDILYRGLFLRLHRRVVQLGWPLRRLSRRIVYVFGLALDSQGARISWLAYHLLLLRLLQTLGNPLGCI